MKLLMMKMKIQWESIYITRWNNSDTVYWGIVPKHSVYIALPTNKKGQPWGGGGEYRQSSEYISVGPAGSHTSQLDLIAGYKISYKTGFFRTIILWLGKMMKPFFSIPGNKATVTSIVNHSKVHDRKGWSLENF
jgi:hypothetical protein